jgi:hypothetical protein
MARDLEADRLVFWQTPQEEGVGGAEIASWTINLNLDYEDGEITPEELQALREILARSPWKHDTGHIEWCRYVRRKEGYGRERFWWWPETW